MRREGAADSWLEAVFRFVVTHPVANSMTFMAMVVFGWVSYGNLPIELMPDVSYPTVTVRTEYAGAAPAEVEVQVSRPIEEALATLDDLVGLESGSRADRSDVRLQFAWGTDVSAASQAIREGLQRTFLPDGVGRPLILKYDPSLDPFLRLSLSFDAGAGPTDPEQALYRLRDLSDHVLQRELEAIDGVAAVRVRGGLEREIRVDVREDWMAARRVRLEDVTAALIAQNVNLAGGSILEGDVEYLVRTVDEYVDLDQIRAVQIRRADGVLVTLTDVAVVRETHKDREVVAHHDGREAVEIELFKEADANIVEVSHRVQDRLFGDVLTDEDDEHTLLADLPDGVDVAVLEDQAVFVEAAIANLLHASAIGGILAIGVTFLFLRDFRATLIISLALPLSVIIGFGPMYLLGVSLNLMSLGGLALGVGMVIDNSIVVLDSIQVRLETGEDRVEACVRGTASIALAVFASTMTHLAVYLPLSFAEGLAGQLFGNLAVAVVGSITASLIVALFLVPMLTALQAPTTPLPTEGLLGALAARASTRELATAAWRAIVDAPIATYRTSQATGSRLLWPYRALRLAVELAGRGVGVPLLIATGGAALCAWRAIGGIVRPIGRLMLGTAGVFLAGYAHQAASYGRFMRWSLRHPAGVLTSALVLFAISVAIGTTLGSELVPEVRQGRIVIAAAMPIGTPLQTTVARITAVEQALLARADVADVYARIGADARSDADAAAGEHSGRLSVVLDPGRARDEDAIIAAIRDDLAKMRDLAVRVERPGMFQVENPVEVVVYGWDLAELRVAGEQTRDVLAAIPGLADAESSLVRGYPELQITYDRPMLSRLGLDAASVAEVVRRRVQGMDASALRREERRIDLKVQLAPQDRASVADLRALNVNPLLVPPIPLDAVAAIVDVEGPSEIRRVDQQRAVVVTANLDGLDVGTTAALVEASMAKAELPAGVTWELAGQSRELAASSNSLAVALLLAVFLVYVVMAASFENLVQPLVILFTVPLAVIGVVAALFIADMPVSVGVFIGLITLAGVVVNNAIVLVDCVNRFLEAGMPPLEAIAAGGSLRLRPILITSLTAIIGLVPLALGFGEAAEIQQPLALSVMGGMISSTLLTLLVIPAALAVVTRGRG